MTTAAYSQTASDVGRLLATRPLLRTVNFHTTPASRVAEYRNQLAHYGRNFSSVSEEDLDSYLRTGKWHKEKPGLIIALYEGYRDHYDVFLPLLQEFGLIGWFFVITEFVKCDPSAQIDFAQRHDISIVPHEYSDGRHALNWDELRAIGKHHVVASHARTHTQLSTLPSDELRSEIVGSQQDFEQFFGRRVRTFVSYAGPAYGEHPAADNLILAAGYKIVVSNYQIQRVQ